MCFHWHWLPSQYRDFHYTLNSVFALFITDNNNQSIIFRRRHKRISSYSGTADLSQDFEVVMSFKKPKCVYQKFIVISVINLSGSNASFTFQFTRKSYLSFQNVNKTWKLVIGGTQSIIRINNIYKYCVIKTYRKSSLKEVFLSE